MSIASHSIVAEFERPEPLVAALRRLREHGFRQLDAYTPYPVEAADALILPRRSTLPLIVLGGAIVGGLLGWFVQYLPAAMIYPVNVGGRPLNSWPAFVPIALEITAICTVLTAFVGFFALIGLPKFYHPIFDLPGFEAASRDRFFLCVDAADPHFDRQTVDDLIAPCQPVRVAELQP